MAVRVTVKRHESIGGPHFRDNKIPGTFFQSSTKKSLDVLIQIFGVIILGRDCMKTLFPNTHEWPFCLPCEGTIWGRKPEDNSIHDDNEDDDDDSFNGIPFLQTSLQTTSLRGRGEWNPGRTHSYPMLLPTRGDGLLPYLIMQDHKQDLEIWLGIFFFFWRRRLIFGPEIFLGFCCKP